MCTGYGYHGDFMMGWNESFLQDAVNTCTNASGMIQDCPLFDVDYVTPETCSMILPDNIAGENVTGPGLTSLPGDVVIQWGPSPATMGPGAPALVTSQPVPTLSYKAGTTASVSGSYLPGEVFEASETSSSTVVNKQDVGTASPSPTTPASSEPTPDTYSVVSTQYVTASNIVSEIVWEVAIVYVTDVEATTTMTQTVTAISTTTVDSANARRDAKRSYMHHHRARHHLGY